MDRRAILLIWICFQALAYMPVLSAPYRPNVCTTLQERSLKDVLHAIAKQERVNFVYAGKAMGDIAVAAFVYQPKESLGQNLQRLLGPLQLQAIKTSSAQYVINFVGKASVKDSLYSPYLLTGRVYSKTDGSPLSLASVAVKNKVGISTDSLGTFLLNVLKGDTLIVTYMGFQGAEQVMNGGKHVEVGLSPLAYSLDGVDIEVGSRFNTPRKGSETLFPVETLSGKGLMPQGRMHLGQLLQYASPSFHTGQYGVNNIAAVVDPATFRGLGPDQLLVLVNGKRRHKISGINLNNTIGKGSAGTDFGTIPAAAVGQVEILRDGASAIYGSDAIAGVINIKLAKGDMGGNYSTQTGLTLQGDGWFTQHALGHGWVLGKKGGWLALNGNVEYRQPTDRGAPYTGLVYRNTGDTSLLDGQQFGTTEAKLTENARLDDSLVLARGFGRDAGIYGTSRHLNFSVWANTEVPLGEQWILYGFGGVSQRKETAYGFFRFPNNQMNFSGIYPDGYLPHFPNILRDFSWNAGIKGETPSGWGVDLSSQYAFNSLFSWAEHTVNASMGLSSPTYFDVGSSRFDESTTNLDFSRQYREVAFLDHVNIATGTELRWERYRITAGEPASYLDANATGIPSTERQVPGANGKPGFSPENEVNVQRGNLGVFIDVEGSIRDRLLLATALRYEYYSDFGSSIAGRLTGRWKLGERVSLRLSANRGFRAPSLQQIYYSQQQSQIFTKNGQTGLFRVQHFRNDDPLIAQLGVEPLRPETSWNVAGGLAGNMLDGRMRFSIDAYRIDIDNRIILSARLDSTLNTIRPLLEGTPNTDIQFFTNAVDTRTYGMDLSLAYRLPVGPECFFDCSFMGAYNRTRIKGQVRTPSGSDIPSDKLLTRTDIGIIEDAQPRSRFILTTMLQWKNVELLVRNSRFGHVAYRDVDPLLDQSYGAKVISDCSFSWSPLPKLVLTAGANNFLDVYPDRVQEMPQYDTNFTVDGQIPYSRTTTPFGFNGASFFVGAKLDF